MEYKESTIILVKKKRNNSFGVWLGILNISLLNNM